MQLSFLDSIHSIPAVEWDALNPEQNPFLQHAFLAALTDSHCVGEQSGWLEQHICIRDAKGTLLAVAPAYIKGHSYGEYVFDWSWADAARRAGIRYYPKLVLAVPFTPSIGPRLLTRPDFILSDPGLQSELAAVLKSGLNERCLQLGLSGWHVLFAQKSEHNLWTQAEAVERSDCQYHWQNHNWQTFDDFLGSLNSRKRKMLRQERRRIEEQSIHFKWLEGADINQSDWIRFHQFYEMTYLKRSGHPGYLNQDFFIQMGRSMPDSICMVIAYQGQQAQSIAAALFFKDQQNLYGRYWGSLMEYEFLHFETCYYQGIEYAIQHDLQTFDAGAQGEHKLKRGFRPRQTHSFHCLQSRPLANAVQQFCLQEAIAMQDWIGECELQLPYKKS